MKFMFFYRSLLVLCFVVLITATASADSSADLEKDNQQYLTIEDENQNGLNLQSSVTFEAHVKFESLEGLGDNGDHTIVSKFDGAHGESAYWFFWRKSDSTLRLLIDDSGFGGLGTEVGVTWNPDLNTWYHIAGVWDDLTNEVKFYIDGQQLGVALYLDQQGIHDSSEAFILGMYANQPPCCSVNTSFFDGQMDEVRVWSVARTQAEIAADMNKVLTGLEPGLEGYWRFEGNYLDETPNGNHLTPINGPQFILEEEPENPVKSFEELLADLKQMVHEGIPQKGLKVTYVVRLALIEGLKEQGKVKQIESQLVALLKNIERDRDRGKVSVAVATDIIATVKNMQALLAIRPAVTLMTQVPSPYPPESSEWADNLLGNGLPSWCGNTIAGCGCAISSLAMVGKGLGVLEGIDGSIVNPQNFNEWLIENDGYTPDNSVIWGRALEYFAKPNGLSIVGSIAAYEYNNDKIADHLNEGGLAIGYEERVGHFFALTDVVEGAGFSVLDPLWYLTKTTSDVKNIANHTQDYGGDVTKARLFTKHDTPQPLKSIIEVHLASPAELLLIDGEGRRVGFDPRTGEHYSEIPGATYEREEIILSQDDPDASPHYEKVLLIPEPSAGLHELKVIGTNNGQYNLTAFVSGGKLASAVAYHSATTSADDVDDFLINVPQQNKGNKVVAFLRWLAGQKEAEKPKVAAVLRAIADKLESKYFAPNTLGSPLELL